MNISNCLSNFTRSTGLHLVDGYDLVTVLQIKKSYVELGESYPLINHLKSYFKPNLSRLGNKINQFMSFFHIVAHKLSFLRNHSNARFSHKAGYLLKETNIRLVIFKFRFFAGISQIRICFCSLHLSRINAILRAAMTHEKHKMNRYLHFHGIK